MAVVTPETRVVFAPQRVGEYALAEVRSCIEWAGKGIRNGWPSIDATIKPLRPGNLCVIHAYTSNYKTGFMWAWARRIAEEIKAQKQHDLFVAYVSWEDTVEEVGLYDLAHATRIDATEIQDGRLDDGQLKRLETAAFQRGALPVWFIGNSLAERKRQPRLTLSQVRDSLGWVEQHMGFKTAIVFLDYLNMMQPERDGAWKDNRRMDIMELTFQSRDLGLAQGCPVVMGAQSNRVSNTRAWKLPQRWDALESSAIEQYCQLMLSLWRPALTEAEGTDLIGPDNKAVTPRLEVTQNLLIMGVNKQKRGEAGRWWPLWVDPAINEIRPMTREADAPPPRRNGSQRERAIAGVPDVEGLPL